MVLQARSSSGSEAARQKHLLMQQSSVDKLTVDTVIAGMQSGQLSGAEALLEVRTETCALGRHLGS